MWSFQNLVSILRLALSLVLDGNSIFQHFATSGKKKNPENGSETVHTHCPPYLTEKSFDSALRSLV